MTTLRDYLNDMLIDFKKRVMEEGEDEEEARLDLTEEYLMIVTKRLIGQ
jgi:hypothetical protein